MAVLKEYGDAVAEEYKKRLTDGGKNASKKLLNSVHAIVERGDQAFDVSLNLMHYWKYVEYGQAPAGRYKQHWPPVNAILEWIKVKPVIPRPDKHGRIPTTQQLAYLIGRKIATKGIEPTHLLGRTLEQINAEYAEKIGQALAADAAVSFSYLFRIF